VPTVVASPPPPARAASGPTDHRTARLAMAQRRRRRALYSLLAVVAVLVVGTIGFQAVAGFGWINAFYFESMLATGQGPPTPLTTDSAKLFASAMAFLSVGTVITTLLFNIGPIVGRLWREGLEDVERKLHRLETEMAAHHPAEGPKVPPSREL